MISFIWPPGEPMLAGTGGSETYTAGHVRELQRRGIEAQVVIIGQSTTSSHKDFIDVPFLSLKHMAEISNLPGKVVFVNNFAPVPTKHKVALIVHNVIPNVLQKAAYNNVTAESKTIIATSVYSAQQWALYLKVPSSKIRVIQPFADPAFGKVKREPPADKLRVVFAGRLYPEKGIYTLLEALHRQAIVGQANRWDVSIVTAGLNTEAGGILVRMLRKYPYAKLIPAQKTVTGMAQVLASNDILAMPSVFAEPFGMLSVEAQHAGCRVVASNLGGLPQTNCGLLTLVKARDPDSLLLGIEQAAALGTATEQVRRTAKNYFTLKSSVDSLVEVLQS